MEAGLRHWGMILDSKMKYEQTRGQPSSQQWIMVSDMVSDAYRVWWIWKKCVNCQQRLDCDHQDSVITALENDPASLLDLWGGLGAHDWAHLEWCGAGHTPEILTDELLPKGVTSSAAHRISKPTWLLIKNPWWAIQEKAMGQNTRLTKEKQFKWYYVNFTEKQTL